MRMMWREQKKNSNEIIWGIKILLVEHIQTDRILRLNIFCLSHWTPILWSSPVLPPPYAMHWDSLYRWNCVHYTYISCLFCFTFCSSSSAFTWDGNVFSSAFGIYAKWVYWKMVIKAQPVFVRGFFVILSKTFGACVCVCVCVQASERDPFLHIIPFTHTIHKDRLTSPSNIECVLGC